MNLQKTFEKIDQFIDKHWPTIVARQENYRANRGQYWQGLPTHLTCPAHENSTDGSKLGDNLAAHPTDLFEDWLAVFPEWASELIPACVRIDIYDGPSGAGWALTLEMTHTGTLYRRVLNVGPESYRAMPWGALPQE